MEIICDSYKCKDSGKYRHSKFLKYHKDFNQTVKNLDSNSRRVIFQTFNFINSILADKKH